MKLNSPPVAIVMGSDSDFDIMKKAAETLEKFGIGYEMTVSSAHRSPERTANYAKKARNRGIKAIIVGAGRSAHLAGVIAAHTTLPVIGIPISGGPLNGVDALYSTVQMPSGVPVATMAIDGAKNAAIFAAEILAISDEQIKKKLDEYKDELAKGVEAKADRLASKK